MNNFVVRIAIAAITTLSASSASANLDELLETEVGYMDATEAVCGGVASQEVEAGIAKFKAKLSADELQRISVIRSNSQEYRKSLAYASKVLQAADPNSKAGNKICVDQALKVGNMPRN